MKKVCKGIAIFLCCLMTFSTCACSVGKDSENQSIVTPPSKSDFWNKPEKSPSEDDNSWDVDLTPDINVTVIGGGNVGTPEEGDGKEDDIGDKIDDGTIDGIYSLVSSAITCDLESKGFSCDSGVAMSAENEDYIGFGIYYWDSEIQLFEAESKLKSVGFVEIRSSAEGVGLSERKESVIVVYDAEEIASTTAKNAAVSKDAVQMVCAYNYENINSYHFVYENKYVMYYQASPMRVVYEIFDNDRENYDLSLGSLYDYDNKQFIYDESIGGEYKNHSAIELFREEDYEKLEKELKIVSERQLANGYEVLEYNIVYISPESIQAYLASEEKATFFGYDVAELTSALGVGTALVYNGTTFEKSSVIQADVGYDWKTFLIKVGIGCGIILVGAILTPITGGASFGCALLTISKVAISFALSSALGTLAIETVTGLIQGKSIEESIKSATHKGLDAFANGFMIGAVVGSVGVVTGAIKPIACFVAGTPIALENNIYKPIEDITVGDCVLSYNEDNKTMSRQMVVEVFRKDVFQTVGLTIDGEYIETTYNHPFYSPTYGGWVQAGTLNVGDYVLGSDGEWQVVYGNRTNYYAEPVTVYNFTVQNNHTYYVGNSETLVHNECKTLVGLRNKGVNAAWKAERQAILDGTSKYNWTEAQKLEIITKGKLSEYAGHHIIPVNEVWGTAKQSLISDPNNIVFLSEANHVWVHKAGDTAAGTIPRVLELVPWVKNILPILGVA